MRLDSRDGVIKHGYQSGEYIVMEVFLKVSRHVIRHLSNTMQCSKPDPRIRVLQMLQHHWYHICYTCYVVHVLPHLRQRHESCIFVPPVLVIGKSVLHKLA